MYENYQRIYVFLSHLTFKLYVSILKLITGLRHSNTYFTSLKTHCHLLRNNPPRELVVYSKNNMKTILHKASSRGHFDHGWLNTSHTFSFADYYDPERINFGSLRVLNDDKIAGGTGFGTHSHHNMEIVSIPLSGDLEHKDSLGHTSVIAQGEIQVMSAGSGIRHSEYNRNKDKAAEFLQIWVIPDRENVEPRYENAKIADLIKKNEISEIVSPYPGNGKDLWIYQHTWFSIGELDKGIKQHYSFKSQRSFGVYIFVIEGSIEVGGEQLARRDGIGIYDTLGFDITIREDSKILVIEVAR